MANTLKNILNFFLIGLLLFNSGGSLIYFKLKEKHIELAAKNAIKEGRYTFNGVNTFPVSDTRIKWEEDDEIRVNGTYYDVIKTEGKYVYCIADKNESELYNWYAGILEAKSKKDDSRYAFMLSAKWYYQQLTQVTFISFVLQIICTAYSKFTPGCYYTVAHPPPERGLVV